MARKVRERKRLEKHKRTAMMTGVQTHLPKERVRTPNYVFDFFNNEFGLKTLVHQVRQTHKTSNSDCSGNQFCNCYRFGFLISKRSSYPRLFSRLYWGNTEWLLGDFLTNVSGSLSNLVAECFVHVNQTLSNASSWSWKQFPILAAFCMLQIVF